MEPRVHVLQSRALDSCSSRPVSSSSCPRNTGLPFISLLVKHLGASLFFPSLSTPSVGLLLLPPRDLANQPTFLHFPCPTVPSLDYEIASQLVSQLLLLPPSSSSST